MNTSKYSYFVIIGTMRSGSNFLEEQLNRIEGINCHGELFNPVFLGRHNLDTFNGIDIVQREADPNAILDVLRENENGVGGFRYFDGHDPRVFDDIINDPSCAKIVLHRNPLDSYLSLNIAKQTGQWKLTNFTRRKSAKAVFEPDGFHDYLSEVTVFYNRVMHGLAIAGQSAFFINYEDLGNVDIFNGLLRFMGFSEQIDCFHGKTKRQNPGSPKSLVQNPDDMRAALRDDDRFGLNRSLWFEPSRNSWNAKAVVAREPNLIFLPLGNRQDERIISWMKSVCSENSMDRISVKNVVDDFGRFYKDAVKFTFLEHPLRRCYDIFCGRVLTGKRPKWVELRRVLRQQHGVQLPVKGLPRKNWTIDSHADAFLGFLRFLALNRKGLTSVPQYLDWASQASLLQNCADEVYFDFLIKAPSLVEDFAFLSVRSNVDAVELGFNEERNLYPLREVVNPDILEAIEICCQRDFNSFGFAPWTPELDVGYQNP